MTCPHPTAKKGKKGLCGGSLVWKGTQGGRSDYTCKTCGRDSQRKDVSK